MKANMSYGPVQVQSHTHSQGPADYEQPVNMEQARDGENAIYEDIWQKQYIHSFVISEVRALTNINFIICIVVLT